MKIGEIGLPGLRDALASEGVRFRVGPYNVRLRSPLAKVCEGLQAVGAHHAVVEQGCFVDFDIEVRPHRTLTTLHRREARLYVDGSAPFKPFPLGHAYAMFEWGLNWCIASRSDRYLLIHAAVVETGGRALLLPAPPGSGKSTLCAALVCRGWRLLSDELAMITRDGTLLPIPRPVSLKNAAIDVMRRFEPNAVLGGASEGTMKGNVAYLRPPADSVDRQTETALPGWVVFPKYEAGAAQRVARHSKARTLVYLAHNSFNYHVHRARGFDLLGDVIDQCECYRLGYGSLDDALDGVQRIVGGAGAR